MIFIEQEYIGKTNIPIKIRKFYHETIASLIKEYEQLDYTYKKRFIFNNKNLNPNLTLAESGITNNSVILVMNGI